MQTIGGAFLNGLLQTMTGNSPRLGLAFSGGGARGFSHIGVMLALEKFNLKPHVIAGVSAGAIAAALCGAGLKASEIRECFVEHLNMGEYREWMVPRDGLMSLHRFETRLRKWLPVQKLEEMKIPTFICVTSLERGKSVGFTSGDTARLVTASCSIPVLFPPVYINGEHYVDGGVLRNLPAWPIRKHCDILLGSNCNPLDRTYRYRRSLLTIALRSFHMMMKANALQDLELCDYVVQNQNLSKYSTFSVEEMDKIIIDGYDAACPVIEKIVSERY